MTTAHLTDMFVIKLNKEKKANPNQDLANLATILLSIPITLSPSSLPVGHLSRCQASKQLIEAMLLQLLWSTIK